MMKILVTGSSGFIGSALVEYFLKRGLTVKGIDIQEPRYKHHISFWENINILDAAALQNAFDRYKPSHVVHLAARTDLGLDSDLDGFKANTDGVRNILNACMTSKGLQRVIFTSTILICEVGYIPKTDDDYYPTTPYGESKVIGERIVRNIPIDASFIWCIIRPTSIWGPGYGSHYIDLFRTIAKGYYLHPGSLNNLVTYGYIGNCVYQIGKLLDTDSERIHRKTFYIGDYWPTRFKALVLMIHQEFGKGKFYQIPNIFVKLAAIIGDVLWKLGWKSVPMTSFRLKNLMTDRLYDTSNLEEITGMLPYNQLSAVKETISWLREKGEV